MSSWLYLFHSTVGVVQTRKALQAAGWRPIWLGHRPSDRHASDKLHLYRRTARATSADALGDIAISDADDNANRR